MAPNSPVAWAHRRHSDLVRIAPPIRADAIFGTGRGLELGCRPARLCLIAIEPVKPLAPGVDWRMALGCYYRRNPQLFLIAAADLRYSYRVSGESMVSQTFSSCDHMRT
jgi:hypothetical protein